MKKELNKETRIELVSYFASEYQNATKLEKGRMINGLVATTGYSRKHAIQLLTGVKQLGSPSSKGRTKVYDEPVRQALVTLWYAANQLCSKRLVPFLPVLIGSLERHGHLHLTDDVRQKVLAISPATVDRMLAAERKVTRRTICTTRSGSMLKKQIRVRTFSDWCESRPGFFEVDLVAHCGDTVMGTFLNTLVLTDIHTGWTECIPILQRSAADVIKGLNVVKSLLPFRILGLDTDNGSEFINYQLFGYCEENEITFTRSRACKKNDQAHVEEKNGSIVRRLVGYDRYEGKQALFALTELYGSIRLYVNFFQPSFKLASKQRKGSKVIKKWHEPKTPLQRLLDSATLSDNEHQTLKDRFDQLDPLALLSALKSKQSKFWEFAWIAPINSVAASEARSETVDEILEKSKEVGSPFFRKTKKKRKPVSHTWRTRQDPFEGHWKDIILRLELNPSLTAKQIMEELIRGHGGRYTMAQLRTLQRRVASWRAFHDDQILKMAEIMKGAENVSCDDSTRFPLGTDFIESTVDPTV